MDSQPAFWAWRRFAPSDSGRSPPPPPGALGPGDEHLKSQTLQATGAVREQVEEEVSLDPRQAQAGYAWNFNEHHLFCTCDRHIRS